MKIMQAYFNWKTTAWRMAAACLFLFSLSTHALAQGNDGLFVIKKAKYNASDDDHYLAHVKVGDVWKLQDATTFSPNCLWYSGREFNLTGTNHNYYFVDGSKFYFLSASFGADSMPYLTEKPETFLLGNPEQNYYFYDWDMDNYPTDGGGVSRGHKYASVDNEEACTDCGGSWSSDDHECWEVYWLEYNNMEESEEYLWKLTSNTYYTINATTDPSAPPYAPAGRFRAVSVESFPMVINGEGGLDDLPEEIDMEYTTPYYVHLSATITAPFNYIPAYKKYDFDERDFQHHTYYHPHGDTNTDTPEETSSGENPSVSYNWSISGSGADYLSFSETGVYTHTSTSAIPSLYYRAPNNDGNKEATLTLTVTYSDGSTQTKTATVNVLTPCQNPSCSANVTYEGVTVSWAPTAESYTVSWQKDGDSDWSSEAVGDVTSYTFTGLEYETQYWYKVKADCTPATSEPTSGTFTTKPEAKALIGGAVFGGGRMADVTGKTEVVIINTDSIGAVYGGNDIFGTVHGNDGSTIKLGVASSDPDAVTYNDSQASTKVRVGDVYGGGNGYYLYDASSFVGATNATVTLDDGDQVKDLQGNTVYTNTSGSTETKTIPSITKTAITMSAVTEDKDIVKADYIFGGAKNAFITASSGHGTSVTVEGGTAFAVFGGNNYGGNQTAGSDHYIHVTGTKTDLTPNIANTATSGYGRDFGICYLFGGGNRVPGLETNILIEGGQCDTVFAGGNAADVNSATVVVNCTMASGSEMTFGNTYTNAITGYASGTPPTLTINPGYDWNGKGVYNVRTLFGGNNKADMAGLPTIILTSGSVGTVYGGGNQGNMLMDSTALSSTIATDFGSPMIGEDAQQIYYSTHVKMNQATMLVDYIYGGCQMSHVDYSTWVEIEDGHVGTVYGGCNISGDVGSTKRFLSGTAEHKQTVQGATYVKASGGTVHGDLFAGANGYYHCNDGLVYVSGLNFGTPPYDPDERYVGDTIPSHNETHVKVSGTALIKGNVYAGGNMAYVGFINETVPVNPSTGVRKNFPKFVGLASVSMDGGTVEGDVYGGGNRASIFGSNEMKISGGTILGALYGGNDRSGQVAQISNRVLASPVASDGLTSLSTLGVNTYVKVTGKPQIHTVYGGGNGAYDDYDSDHYCDPTNQPVQSNTFVDINIDGFSDNSDPEHPIPGGHIDNVYGGGNGVTVTGGITVLLNVQGTDASTPPEVYDHVNNIFGGNNEGSLAILPDIILLKGQVQKVYGGCNKGSMTGSYDFEGYHTIGSRVHLSDTYTPAGTSTPKPLYGVVSDAVYGGCRMNDVTHNSIVLVEGGNYSNAEIFGGCDISGVVSDTSWVVLKKGTVGNAYGGGDGDYYYKPVSGHYEVYTDETETELLAENVPDRPFSGTSYVKMLNGTAEDIYAGGKLAIVTGNSNINIAGGTANKSVYGGGKGSTTYVDAGLVKGNALVEMTNGLVKRSIYGGGEMASVGTFTEYYTVAENGHFVDEPKTCASGTGLAQVLFRGGSVGDRGSKMPTPGSEDDYGWIFCGSRGEVDSITYPNAHLLAVVNTTYLEISGGVVTASVYGGSENGLVMNGTHVKITGGQIGTGYRGGDVWDDPYSESQWNDAITAVKNGTFNSTYDNPFHECDAWPYAAPYYVYDIYANDYESQGGATTGTNGHSFFGNVFGGGSGFYPIRAGVWRHSAGRVWGNTLVEIEGGHILTSVYGGNETTDVMGKCTVRMSGGTLGVPRTASQIALHPVTCYLFGGGMGDPRPYFDNMGNVNETEVIVTGGTIFGSTFGGGEDGHVIGNAVTRISEASSSTPTIIGSTGFSSADGNIFGGGRGFTANDPTNGRVGGNITINFTGGKILGNIYGGGRLANTGMKADGTMWNTDLSNHGHITVNVSGGTIGRDLLRPEVMADHPQWKYEPENHVDSFIDDAIGHKEYLDYVGHVFGGGMGLFRATNKPPTPAQIADNMNLLNNYGRVISTEVNIQEGANIYGNVYGGGKLGKVVGGDGLTYFTDVNVTGGIVHRRVFGGGKGVVGNDYIDFSHGGDVAIEDDGVNTPIKGDVRVRQSGGAVKVCLYGGAETANVHGDTYVILTGGEVGRTRTLAEIAAQPSHCYVFGGGKGDPHEGNYNLWTNVDNAHVDISGTSRIFGSAFGGGEDGHVLNDIEFNFHLNEGGILGTHGYSSVDGNIFCGGRGFNAVAPTAGGTGGNINAHVYGSGTILGSIFGGGRIASTGVIFDALMPEEGGHAGESKPDDDPSDPDPHTYGHVTLLVEGDVVIGHDYVSAADSEDGNEYLMGDIGGNVYGGAKGADLNPSEFDPDPNGTGKPYDPNTSVQAIMGHVKYTDLTVQGNVVVKGSVYGGGEMGRVLKDTKVTIDENAVIGVDRGNPSSPMSSETLDKLKFSGRVHGGGWGSSSAYYAWKNNSLDATTLGRKDVGRVHGNTEVFIKGGTIYNTIYGGGAFASIGDFDGSGDTITGTGHTSVIMSGGTLGPLDMTGQNAYVYGGGRGMYDKDNITKNFGQVFNTYVEMTGGTVLGSIFGGAEDGDVLGDCKIEVEGGNIGTTGQTTWDGNIFGAGRNYHAGANTESNVVSHIAVGRVGGNVTINITDVDMKGDVFGGGRLGSLGIDDTGALQPDDGGKTYGHTTITISGGLIGDPAMNTEIGGNVYGGGKGKVGTMFDNLALVSHTSVTISGDAHVTGTVYGGSENGHIGTPIQEGSTNVLIAGGEIGTSGVESPYKGNVYGGGRGIEKDANGNPGQTAGAVYGNTRVTVTGGNIYQYVFGGGEQSMVLNSGRKIVNIKGGWVHKDVYGGSNAIPDVWGNLHPGLKTVNMYGGKVNNVYGCSHASVDGSYTTDGSGNILTVSDDVTSYVNISGGEVYGSVHGAGHGGVVYGSVVVNIGKNAIYNAPSNTGNTDKENGGAHSNDIANVDMLNITGSVYGGSDHFGLPNNPQGWQFFNVKGYSNIYIDGDGYDTEHDLAGSTVKPYFNISGNVYGSGNSCESAEKGRNITIRNYGTRITSTASGEEGWFTGSTRTMATIQRCGNLVIDNSNFTFTGAPSIDGDDGNLYSVYKIDTCFYVANASGITLGAGDVAAHMDSIRMLRSVHLVGSDDPSNPTSVYEQVFPEKLNWEWIGIREQNQEANKLYYISETNPDNQLPLDKENVMVFNKKAKLYVRYSDPSTSTTKYGQLNGFFRMIADDYLPWGKESFAYARPKLTNENMVWDGYTTGTPATPIYSELNKEDGGFMSYTKKYNFYPSGGNDGGADHTKTNQYPYFNEMTPPSGSKDSDHQDYRLWVRGDFNGTRWYVDGTNGEDRMDTGWGEYPDRPKKTLTGTYGVFAGNGSKSFNWDTEVGGSPVSKDVIYVINPIEGASETATAGVVQINKYPDKGWLEIFRYPGGHELFDNVSNTDPGANYGALLNVGGSNNTIVLDNVLLDGLYGHVGIDNTYMDIPASFTQTSVTKPLVVTVSGSKLTLKGTTTLMRGYNNTSTNFDTNKDFGLNASGNPDPTNIPLGGAIFVHNGATLNVEGAPTVTGNLQRTDSGDLECNVFLPSFSKAVTISNALSVAARIGITNPVRNTGADYTVNTLSPVATAGSTSIADDAYQNNNFRDDLDWFFGSGTDEQFGNHTTYHRDNTIPTLYFGWTWNNVVRSAPSEFAYNDINSADDLAWLSSLVSGQNVASASDLASENIALTSDIDLKQYVWVPIGSEVDGTAPFAGSFDGQGHIIKNLNIEYIGTGDTKYQRNNYGLFGNLEGATINRTFVIGGQIHPVGKANIGGIAGWAKPSSTTPTTIKNSEAAVNLTLDNPIAQNAAGGLVGHFLGGEIHSSMAMPTITASIGYIGGLVGHLGDIENNLTSTLKVNNSFANIKYDVGADNNDIVAGGLVGYNKSGNIANCYVQEQPGCEGLTSGNYGTLTSTNMAIITNCYDYTSSYSSVITNSETATMSNCVSYTNTVTSDNLGYMYSDNTVTLGEEEKPLFDTLNGYISHVLEGSGGASALTYARWARPTLPQINGDLPVLLLDNYDGAGHIGSGDFRSVSTYAGGPALQYGGQVRDNNQLNTALGRAKADGSKDDYLFIYGDLDGTETINATITASKVAIHENAAIKAPGTLANFANTYVGISFDNSSRHAYSSPDIGALGDEAQLLPNDWHIFSSPLSHAPLGFDYGEDNVDGGFSNNPWISTENERYYWMDDDKDGYFPFNYGASLGFTEGQGIPEGSSDFGHYPYSMDLMTWYEPENHWINFKRNGPNHWHNDGDHDQITYYSDLNNYGVSGEENQNEDNLVVGKGYMAAITEDTYLQSHGSLNTDGLSMSVSALSQWQGEDDNVVGWNLVGNPYHAYLDFEALAEVTSNDNILSKNDESKAFYVVYSADAYDGESGAESAYLTYPVGGSLGGAYADRYIHPHQGFFVLINKDTEPEATNLYSLSFAENMTVTRSGMGNATSTFRATNKQPAYPLLNLYLNSTKGCSEVTVVELFRPEWGGAQKMRKLNNGNGCFYGYHEGERFAALFVKDGTSRIPVHFEAFEEDVFTIQWEAVNGEFSNIYLVDNLLGVKYDMTQNQSYTFEGKPEDYKARFYILLADSENEEPTDDDDDDGHSFAFFNGNEWIVNGQGQLELVDVLGRILQTETLSSDQNHVHFNRYAAGVYMLRLTESKNKVETQKIIIK